MVDLGVKTCSCRRWALCGIPCPHAIVNIKERDLEIHDFVHYSLLKSTYGQVYDLVWYGYVAYLVY